ncbi:MAG TPA: hypothetical protein PKK48_02150 [Phycisphaerae bacterium]|nr:hypothetical protein [Phycisphaerae bacterium]HPS52666.1 hypothetical protein [Phycisphaerae bacterium]
MNETSNNYYFTVIVLLVVMLVAMAGLWVMEHKKLNRAVAFIRIQQNEKQTQDTRLRDMLLNATVEKNHMLDRDSFVKKGVTINGRLADVFVVTADDAAKAGLLDGDIIFVGKTFTPSTQPSPAPKISKTAEIKNTGQ